MNLYEKYYVYTILSLRDFDTFTGLTNNLKTRIEEHMKGIVSSTRIRIPFKLIHYEYFVNLEDARKREMFLKSARGKAELKDSLKRTLASKTYVPYKLIK